MKHILMILLAAATAVCGQDQYAFTNFAGMPGGEGSVDGTGSSARFSYASGVAVDSAGNVYVADLDNNTIRKITPVGVVTTLAGSARQFGSADGNGSAARFSDPSGVAVDNAGNVYVADFSNETIRKITPDGEVKTLAGSAGQGGSDEGTGSAARFYGPWGVAVDSAGSVYVADARNHTIRKITPAGEVTTLAGMAGFSGSADGPGSAARFNDLNGVAVDSGGNVYVADSGNNTIRKITPDGVVTTLAGSARQQGSDDGTGSAARFHYPGGVAVDGAGNVYVADQGNRVIRKITPVGVVTTLAGSAGQLGGAGGVAVDTTGNIYAAGNTTIWKMAPSGEVTTLAGSVRQSGSVDGTGSAARFSGPRGVAVDSLGNLYVADSGNYTIRKITPHGDVTTLAGTVGQSGSADGIGTAARFILPSGLAVDSADNLYVADENTIRKMTPVGVVTTLAGRAGSSGSADGIGSAALFSELSGVAVDIAGNIYVADTDNDTIRKITGEGVVTTFAGTAGQQGSDDGTANAARFHYPTSIALDGAGNVYVADFGNSTIRKITPDGVVTTLAGKAGQQGSADGTGSAARFYGPYSVAVDSVGNVYLADRDNYTIRKITPAGVVATLAGSAGQAGGADGIGSAAQFNYPFGVAVDSAGNVYVADTVNNRITKGTPLALAPLQFTTAAGSLGISNGFFKMRLTGPSGSNLVVEASANLQAWTPVQTNALPPTGLDLSLLLDAKQNQFFRARLAP